MASDGISLYYLAGHNLSSVGLTGAQLPTPVAVVAAGADRLQVDANCVYWVEANGARIMRRAK